MKKTAWILILLAGCGGEEEPAQDGTWRGLASALKSASSAEAWRIGGNKRFDPDFFNYKELSGPVAVEKSPRKELTRILSDPKSIDSGVHPCMPMPGVKVRYNRPKALPISVLFCFECHELFVFEGDTQPEHKGFDNAVSPLAQVMKQVFPNDAVIQSLK